jgi:hypothetical protein
MVDMGLTRLDVRPVLESPFITYDACERIPGQNSHKDDGNRICGFTPGGVAITLVVSFDRYLITISPWMAEGYARVKEVHGKD